MLYLRPDERDVFSLLPSSLVEGWQVVDETVEPRDSASAMRVRLELLHLQDAALKDFAKKAAECSSADEAAALFNSMDLSAVEDADLAELFFALGSVSLTGIIKNLLAKVSKDDDLQDLEALTGIRRSLLASLS